MTPPTALTSTLLASGGLPHAFTTRHLPGMSGPRAGAGGPLAPEAQAELARRGLAVPVAFGRQVHGASVLRPTAPGLAGTGDALLTATRGLGLAVFTADCLPVIVHDRRAGRLLAVHAGWRGTVRSVTRLAVEAMLEAGSRAEDLVAAIGPSIGPCCYEVDAPVIDALEAAFPGRWPRWARPGAPGRWMLDLWAANEDQLVRTGIAPDRIDNLRLCTACRHELLFSYRRGGDRGRLAAVAALP